MFSHDGGSSGARKFDCHVASTSAVPTALETPLAPTRSMAFRIAPTSSCVTRKIELPWVIAEVPCGGSSSFSISWRRRHHGEGAQPCVRFSARCRERRIGASCFSQDVEEAVEGVVGDRPRLVVVGPTLDRELEDRSKSPRRSFPQVVDQDHLELLAEAL